MSTEQKLSGDYRALYEQAQNLPLGESFPQKRRDAKLRELHDMLTTAQALERPTDAVTGGDDDRFLQRFFADSGWRALGAQFAEIFRRVSFVLLAEVIFVAVFSDKPLSAFFSLQTELAVVLAGVIGGIALTQGAHLLQPAAKRFRYSQNVRFILLETLIFAALIAAETGLFNSDPISLPLWVPALFAVLYIPAYFIWRALRNKKTYGTTRDLRAALYRDAEKSLTDEMTERAMAEGMLKQYADALERGKVTEEGFLDAMQIDEKKMARGEWVLILVMALIVIGGTALGAKGSDEREVILLACLLTAVGCGVYRLYRRFDRRGRLVRRKFYAECEKKNMTLPAYLMQRIAPQAAEQLQAEAAEQAAAETPEQTGAEAQEPAAEQPAAESAESPQTASEADLEEAEIEEIKKKMQH